MHGAAAGAAGISIRDAEPRDLGAVREIYNHYVATSTVTFDEDGWTEQEVVAKFDSVVAKALPFLIAEDDSGVVGFAYLAPWRVKAAYRYTVENSIYLAASATGRGVGVLLLDALLDRARAAGIREVIAVLSDEGADASHRLHLRAGFREVGRLEHVGFKFDRWLGIVLLQKSL
ncbi:GNAT family N-acetyltransferase [Ruicaihuangia caeni]|uniref:N-acetyltransferase family protein n=1 Tax=Ruicaihuangia caeni TaxID=3042517 RepID=A0AAW6T4Z3_9MICO|nr:GNAT family N-acetyltransferase [Klugiella sp. YN-L-19]MDI2097438.1 N-acetyltransferase family protein [Klugiella sp. YN-L-19]